MRSESGNVAIDDTSSPSNFSNVLTLKGRGVIFGPDRSLNDWLTGRSVLTTDDTVVLGVWFDSVEFEPLSASRGPFRAAGSRLSVVDDGTP